MGLLRRWLGPKNALIFLYDHLDDESGQAFETEIAEAKQYYRFVTVSEIAEAVRAGKPEGLAAVAFRQARRSVLLRAIPYLRAEKIPATLYVVPDGVGTNRLTAREELEIYFKTYPDALAGESLEDKVRRAWEDPAGADAFLKECRGKVGPLPLDTLDPTRFSSTWGRLLEIPPELREIGLHLTSPFNALTTSEDLNFVGRQAGKAVTSLYSPRRNWGEAKITGVVIEEKGMVEKGSDPLHLPVWNCDIA